MLDELFTVKMLFSVMSLENTDIHLLVHFGRVGYALWNTTATVNLKPNPKMQFRSGRKWLAVTPWKYELQLPEFIDTTTEKWCVAKLHLSTASST